MKSEKGTISLRSVAAFEAPPAGEARLWDDKLAGFCLRAYAASSRSGHGRKVYAVKYRLNGKQNWVTIGEHGKPWKDRSGATRPGLTPDMARDEAARIVADAKRGDDPKAPKRVLRADRTVGELIDVYLAEGPSTLPDKRATSWATDRSNLERHLRPLLGAKLSTSVTRDDVTKMLASVARGATAKVEKTKARGKAIVTGGEGVRHRVLSATKAMFGWAIERGYHIGQNPCVGVRLPRRPAAERFLSEAELNKLMTVIDRLELDGEIRPTHAAIFRLLILTGARRNEIVELRWREVDLDRALVTLPPARTKSGQVTGERHILLNRAAVEIIRALSLTATSEFLFPATKGGSGHTTTVPKVWRMKVRPAAEMIGLRIHDLRHSFASFALADGASLPLVGKALGHRSLRSTERYGHLGADPVRSLSEKVASRMTNEARTGRESVRLAE